MPKLPVYAPAFYLTRGDTIESIHYASVAVVDNQNNLVASYGDPEAITFLRSSAKPFQVLPFVESGGVAALGFTDRELALMCASHSGTDDHAAVAASIQAKAGIREEHLMCGVHPPTDERTARELRTKGLEPTPNRHNCSGKHSGMLAFSQHNQWDLATYLELDHPVQQRIIQAFAEMAGLEPHEIHLGIDGCSAPNFAMPLRNAALAIARLCDPEGLAENRADASRKITRAMMAHPDMIGGPGRFDTRLMEAASGRLVSKGGAEGYQAIGLMPGALAQHRFGAGPSPALGVAIKIADGGLRSTAAHSVAIEVLRQLGALSPQEEEALTTFSPVFPVYNWRKLVVGEGRPCFELNCN